MGASRRATLYEAPETDAPAVVSERHIQLSSQHESAYDASPARKASRKGWTRVDHA